MLSRYKSQINSTSALENRQTIVVSGSTGKGHANSDVGTQWKELDTGNEAPDSAKQVNQCWPESEEGNLMLKAAQTQNEEKS